MDDDIADALATNLWQIFPSLFWLIRRGWQSHKNQILTIYHYEILGLLLQHNRMSMSEIGRLLGISRLNITPMIDKLVDEGLVQRSEDKEDRRVIQATLTIKGTRFMEAGKQRAKEDMQVLFAWFSQ